MNDWVQTEKVGGRTDLRCLKKGNIVIGTGDILETMRWSVMIDLFYEQFHRSPCEHEAKWAKGGLFGKCDLRH